MIPLIQAAQRPVVAVPPSSAEEYITKHEVARRMRTPVRTVDRWMGEGIIPFYKVKRSVRFRWSEVQAHWAARYRLCPKRNFPAIPHAGPVTTDHGTSDQSKNRTTARTE